MSTNGTGIKYLLKRAYLGVRGPGIRLLIRSRALVTADPDTVRSILVIRIDRIGDLVISLPAIKALQSIFPNARISVLAQKSNVALLANVPYVAEAIPYTGFGRSVARLRRNKFDMAVDLLMDYSIKTAAMAFLSGAKVRAGYDIASRGGFFNITVPPDTKEKHMSEHTLDIVRAIGKSYGPDYRADWNPQPRLKVSDAAMAAARDILKRSGISKEDRIVCIHPGGHFPSQRWMPAAFAELADRTAIKHNARIVIIGSPSEAKLVEGIVSLAKTKPAFITCRGIDVIAAVIAASDLLVCNNSGPLHIAGALGTPTVSTMGPTVPYLWRPLGPRNTVIRREIPCSPCDAGSCADHECMKRISVNEMEEALARQLEKPSTQKAGSVNAVLRKGAADKILVVNLGGIGDAILSTPALRALKETYPRARLYFLGIKRVNEFIKSLAYIDEVLNFELSISPGAMIRDLKTLLYLKGLKIDLAVNMRTLVSERSAMKFKFLLRLIGPKITAGRDTEARGDFFDIRIPESGVGDKGEMEYDLDIIRSLGGDIVSAQPDFPIDAASQNKVRAMLGEHGIAEGEILIGVHPGGKPSHRWGAEKFAEAIDAINGNIKARFIITGDGEDASIAKTIIGYSKAEIIDATGKLSIQEMGALITRCNLYICNDTAAMHIAVVLKVPLIAIFGPGYLKRFDPRNISKDAVVVHRETACAPCDKKICRNMKCLETIASDEVIRPALRLLKAK